ncbi:lysogenization regulator HflD [Alginatibacterium sediminis]|uniref:High frequency lysogenization protein HflD homolog n=1 Tax=Alginatibacterium sediminis TaxID=2164068 RepID=A0A420EGP2_9ALTE|nr:high frequency lysogenization protein HflD [Alginatibacterium sediminis]RKF19843.1 lysogenization regulator HflD [Alginatibacterium sediminis]
MSQMDDRIMALAALCQSIKLVQDVAHSNSCDAQGLKTSINSVLAIDADSCNEIYGGPAALKDGYSSLIAQLNSVREPKTVELTRYMVGILALERKLAKRPDLLAMLGERITQIQRQLQHFDPLDEQVLANTASIYSDIISPAGPKIQVHGNVEYLKIPLAQNKIRTLLLSAIRACVLWRQLGGKRRQLLFSRGQYASRADEIYQAIV